MIVGFAIREIAPSGRILASGWSTADAGNLWLPLDSPARPCIYQKRSDAEPVAAALAGRVVPVRIES